ncbi:MAG: patatin family protein [Ruminococcaceae bacterium]|nr:patatin family protein [Oscillospiraceae bacterium]
MINPDTALVLEGGGMRGFYTIGVLDYFMDAGIEFPAVYGVSAGACHAMSYLSRQRGRAFRIGVDYLDNWRYCSVRSLILTGDLFGADFLYNRLPNELYPFDYAAFRENPAKMFAVCSNLVTGKAEYVPITDGADDIVYVRASSSLPLVSRTVKTPRGKLLDGGICDSIPVRRALSEYKRAVVVLTQPRGFKKEPSSSAKLVAARYARYPKFVEAAKNRHIDYNESLAVIDEGVSSGGIFCLRPSAPIGFSRIEKDVAKLTALYERGYADAKASGIDQFL